MTKKQIVKIVAFVFCFVALLLPFMKVFEFNDPRMFQTWTGFYDQEDDSLDAVYVGASNVYSFICPVFGWNEYGYKVYPLAIPNMPASSMKYVIEESRKTQPDALYIVCLNNFKDITDVTASNMHFLCDFMRFSPNKVNLLNSLYDLLPEEEKSTILEYYFPFIRFHARWNSLTAEDFVFSNNGLKGSSAYDFYLNDAYDISPSFYGTEECGPVSEPKIELLNDLLDYCEETDINVLFVLVPQGTGDEGSVKELNALGDHAENRGFKVYNMNAKSDEIGLSTLVDYYNDKHLNIHGSIKYTRYFCDYLTSEYEFPIAKAQSDEIDDSWDKAYSDYMDVISPYVIDFEVNGSKRSMELEIPIPELLIVDGTTKIFQWTGVSDADELWIYRKDLDPECGEYRWSLLACLDPSVTAYVDDSPTNGEKVTYTVVPVKYINGEATFGNFNGAGITRNVG